MVYLKNVNELPNTSGVYLFKHDEKILYIGKSVNIKARVKSHIENAKLDRKEALIVQASNLIDYIICDSELKAILLEASLIQKYHPKYNVIWQDDKSFLYIKIAVRDEYPKILLSRRESDLKSRYFGPFSSVATAENILKEIRRIIPFCTQKNLKANPCFYSKIGLCNPCPSAIIKLNDLNEKKQQKKIYRQNIRHVVRILEGRIEPVIKNLYKEIKVLSRNKKFEEAILIRNKIIRFEHLLRRASFDFNPSTPNRSEESLKTLLSILNLNFPNLQTLSRIECYDISNLRGQNAAASMVVFSAGLIDKSQYRRFKIKDLKAKSDFEMLVEILNRRFKTKKVGWPKPDLIVVDGGTPQVRILLEVLKKLELSIPLIGIAKNPDRLVMGLAGFPVIKPANNNLGFNLIQHIRDESHRFAHKYHLMLRRRELLL